MGLVDYNSTELAREVQTFAVDRSTTASELEVAAAVAGKRAVFLGCVLGAKGGAWTVAVKSASTAKTGNIPIADGGSLVLGLGALPIKCADGEALTVDLTRTAGDLDGVILYAYETVL